MSNDRFFFRFLEEKYSELLKVAVRKNYIFLIPSAKYVSTQNKNFYESHTFYQSEYEPNYLISLQGKVLEHKDKAFHTYLGFKKEMVFNVEDELYRGVNIQGVSGNPTVKTIYIDNVIDENSYNSSVSSTLTKNKNDSFNRLNTKDEYLTYFKNCVKMNPSMKEVEVMLNEITDKMINNYILIKNHIQTYAMHFQQEFNPLKQVRRHIILNMKHNYY